MEKNKKLRVYVDTNIFISLLAFKSQRMRHFLEVVQRKHTLLLSTAVLDEIDEVLSRRFPKAIPLVSRMLRYLQYELIPTPAPNDSIYKQIVKQLPPIKDPDDVIIFVGAWIGKSDVIVSHDKKHFHTKEVKSVFTVMTVYDFLLIYDVNP
ncbi:putative toxin-antitoxin system toxin component, PIN family [Shimazuella sp. AN120528]|uniref:putative toxin-antitoxin system toxin component, PIN family n=1 Tax=Shimazuella soli TaxID=1892854 RepID=UPI001F103DD2|nr:putative toxin-antitoxin system toxin component, PIN family [Shimazuella soli]MCH5585983.1 putative toxin-antitoxin system toxin component, PIN family [Shimazuella soli]